MANHITVDTYYNYHYHICKVLRARVEHVFKQYVNLRCGFLLQPTAVSSFIREAYLI